MLKNVISLFDGISCARQAIEKNGIKPEKYYASEIDKYAVSITQKNFSDTIQVGDVTKLKGEDFKDVDLIIGGFPCQSYSIAGNRKGMEDPRGQLVFEFVRLLREIKPKHFIGENVASMKKEIQEEIRVLFEEAIGRKVYIHKINASLVSAQNRNRIFFTDIENIPQPEDKGIILRDILEEEVDEKYFLKNQSYEIVIKEGKSPTLTNSPIKLGHLNKGGQGDRIYSQEGKSVILSANGGGRGAKTGLYAVVKNNGVWKERKEEKTTCLDAHYGSFPDNHGMRTGVYVINEYNNRVMTEKCGTLGTTIGRTSKQGYQVVNDEKKQIRKLTPIEAERLQCVPDKYTEFGINEKGEQVKISDTQRYKCLGNGFNVDVVAHIIKFLD